MRIVRRLIDGTTHAICYLKRNQRIVPRKRTGPVKINLGCGLAVAKRWINVDGSLNAMVASWPGIMHRLLYRMTGANRYYTRDAYCALLSDHEFVHHDLSYGIPFKDGTVDHVYSSHFLEHVFRKQAQALIRESYRVLKPGGKVRISVPDLAYALSLYAKGEKEKMLNSYFFVEDDESYFARHKYMYDYELLKEILEQAGFINVVRYAYRQGAVPDLELLDNRPEDSLFVEAQKAVKG